MKEPLNAARDAAHPSVGDARVKLDVMDYLIKEPVALDKDNAKAAADDLEQFKVGDRPVPPQ